MKKSDFHILIALILIAPHLNVWAAGVLAVWHFAWSGIFASQE